MKDLAIILLLSRRLVNLQSSYTREGLLTGKCLILAIINLFVFSKNSILTSFSLTQLPEKSLFGQNFSMTGLFQKVNHLGKSELTGSAGYAIEEGKNDHFPPFPKA